jgi:putative endonuclease
VDDRHRTGLTGERAAAEFLVRRGAEITARNLRSDLGEIDLVAIIDGTRTAVEVRSRRGEDPLDAFDWSKIDRVRRTAGSLEPPCVRVDLITIEFTEATVNIRWLPDV